MGDKLWENMYEKDKYAKLRVIKSVRLLLPYLKSGDTVLDVGCFTQEARKYLPSDIKYLGIDEKAYHNQNILVNLDRGFDEIPCSHALSLEVLEHLKCPKHTLLSIYKSLQKEGILVVSLPNEATLFHRIRCLFGIVDSDCFSSEGKHIHLPSLNQARTLFQDESMGYHLQILKTEFYISPSGMGSKPRWVGRILSLIPDTIHQFLADLCPSLFARGFIFLCKKK